MNPDTVRNMPGRDVLKQAGAAGVCGLPSKGFYLRIVRGWRNGRSSVKTRWRLLQLTQMVEEKPANDVRCLGRYLCGELEDKPWNYHKAFWGGYLDRLVASRFNRFALGYELEYRPRLIQAFWKKASLWTE